MKATRKQQQLALADLSRDLAPKLRECSEHDAEFLLYETLCKIAFPNKPQSRPVTLKQVFSEYEAALEDEAG